MPIALSPDPHVWIILAADHAQPEETRPAYKCRFPTVREVLRIQSLIQEAKDEKDPAKCVSLLVQAVSVTVIGHRNIPGEFKADQLDAVLTARELWELAYGVLAETGLEEKKRRQSGLASRQDTAPPASAPAGSVSPPSNP